MNIAICVTQLSYAMGGVSTHILDLCKYYSSSTEIDNIILCCEGGEHISKLDLLVKVKYYSVNFESNGMNLKGVYKSYKEFYSAIKKENIDLIHVHSQRIIPVCQLIKLIHRIPYIWTNHIDAVPQEKTFKMFCRLFRFPIISVSIELRNMMIKQYNCNPNKVFVVNNGTDLDELTPLNIDEKSNLEKRWDINREKTPYVICLLSRMFYVKGHMTLLKAINMIPNKEQIKVIFAGHTYPNDISYRNSLIEYSRDNNIDLKILDFSKPRDVFGVSDLFCLPSIYEGFPLVCIEALACGCAVIRSRTPGWQEMQDYVEIVEKNDIEGLSHKIQLAIENGFNKEKTLRGQKAVRERFTKENCALNTIEIYKKFLKSQ